nr:P-type conjugative transfer protein TrbG [Sphingopyxis indica]
MSSPTIAAESRDPKSSVGRANDAARVQPERATFQGAIQKYAWEEGALFQVYTAPGRVTDIVLQDGEELVGPGPVAAGDTVRWIIGDTVGGNGANRRVHILVKPTRPDIMTNIVINTSRRTYHLELRATPATYMASVSWSYPEAELIALRAAEAERERIAPVAAGLDLTALNFRYRLSGDKPDWRPVRVFDDGRQIFIEFGEGIATGDMPPLFAADEKGEAELLNYRVHGRFMIVDRLFERGELRMGAGRSARKVIIERAGRVRGRS